MPERIINNLLNMQQRQEFLTQLSVFSQLSEKQSEELASLMYERRYQPGEDIVIEGVLIDNVCIITQGRAEVTRVITKKNKITKKIREIHTPIAIVEVGDSIGLNDTGFFSPSGKRVATVKALTEVTVLVLDLKDLHHFLHENQELESSFYTDSLHILRVKLIKQALPFSHLSHKRLQWLASKVEEMHVAAGSVIFTQGEMGDRCYLIRSGQVEILSVDQQGSEQHLSTLTSPTLFGEATLITHAPRNATARALEHCELLVLQHKYLSELLESELNVAKMFMTLMVDRSRPLRNPLVTVHHRLTADKQPITILKNPQTGNYFKLSTEGGFIWQQLNGKQTMQSITIALAEKHDIFAPDVVAGLISKLAKAGFVKNVEVNHDHLHSHPSLGAKILYHARKILEKRVVIGDADKWISSLYDKCKFLLTPVALVCLSIISIAGFIAFCLGTSDAIHIFRSVSNGWILFILLIPFTLITVGLHELGHAIVMKSFKHEVHYMGVGWYWLSPIVFTDTSDMWLSPRAARMTVNVAGIAVNMIVAGLASLLFWVIPHPYVQGFLWIFAIYTYLSAFRVLNPLQELDGYYLLMDALDSNHLRHKAVSWLVKDFPKLFRQKDVIKNHLPELFYWLASILFLILLCLVTWFVQALIFKLFGFTPTSSLTSLILPLLVVVVSSIGLVADILGEENKTK